MKKKSQGHGQTIMKTIDEIINNAHYEKLNGALCERTKEIAEKIRDAMYSAEITEIGDYYIRTVQSHSGFTDTILYIETEVDTNWGCDTKYRNLEISKSRYYMNDFNCWIEAANGKDRLKFLNDAKNILEEIDNIKQKRITDIENALKSTDEL